MTVFDLELSYQFKSVNHRRFMVIFHICSAYLCKPNLRLNATAVNNGVQSRCAHMYLFIFAERNLHSRFGIGVWHMCASCMLLQPIKLKQITLEKLIWTSFLFYWEYICLSLSHLPQKNKTPDITLFIQVWSAAGASYLLRKRRMKMKSIQRTWKTKLIKPQQGSQSSF